MSSFQNIRVSFPKYLCLLTKLFASPYQIICVSVPNCSLVQSLCIVFVWTVLAGHWPTQRDNVTQIIIIITIFLHGLGRLTRSGIDALPSFPRASTNSSFPKFVVEGVFRKSGVVHSFKMADPVLFVFGSHDPNYFEVINTNFCTN